MSERFNPYMKSDPPPPLHPEVGDAERVKASQVPPWRPHGREESLRDADEVQNTQARLDMAEVRSWLVRLDVSPSPVIARTSVPTVILRRLLDHLERLGYHP